LSIDTFLYGDDPEAARVMRRIASENHGTFYAITGSH